MSRGNGRAAVFLDPADYGRFLEQLDHGLDSALAKQYEGFEKGLLSSF
jgi:uncharacterized protein (DUF1919 family)